MERRAVGALGLLAFALWFLQPTIGEFSGFLDEGLILAPAVRILGGEVPYADFYLYIGPIPPLLYALSFAVAGVSVASAHLLLALIRAACAVLLYLLARRVVPPLAALVPALVLLFSFGAEPVHYANHWTANLLVLLGAWAMGEAVARPGGPRLFLAGFAAGLALLGLPQFGLALLLADLVGLALLRDRSRSRDLGALLAGVAAAVLPCLAVLGWLGALPALWRDLVADNLYRVGFEGVPWAVAAGILGDWLRPGAGVERLLSGALIALGLAGTLVVAPIAAWRDPGLRRPGFLLVLALALATYASMVYKLLPSQFQLHQYFAFVVLAALAARAGRAGPVLLAGLLALSLPLGVLFREQAAARVFPVDFPRGEVRVASADEARELQRLVRFLGRRTAGVETAFFTPYEPNLYFLMDLGNPTRYPLLRPQQFSPRQMQEALDDLGASPRTPIFHFPAYESEAFLRLSWPAVDLAAYRAQGAWFEARLREGREVVDCGAVVVYRPPGLRPAAPPPGSGGPPPPAQP